MSPPDSPAFAPRPAAEEPDDAALVRAMRADDARAFQQLYERHWYALYATAYRKLASREAAEEIVQDVFATLWQRRATARIDQLAAYLHTAVRYRVIDFFRAEERRRTYLGQLPPGPATTNTADTVAAADLSQALDAGVAELPPHTREVFRLSRTEHQTVPEIASHLNLSPKTVEYHLTRALKLLRVSLRDFLTVAVLLTALWR